MRIVKTIERVKHVCLICFQPCDVEVLKTHHHCCEAECEKKFLEITSWEHSFLGDSLLETLSKNY